MACPVDVGSGGASLDHRVVAESTGGLRGPGEHLLHLPKQALRLEMLLRAHASMDCGAVAHRVGGQAPALDLCQPSFCTPGIVRLRASVDQRVESQDARGYAGILHLLHPLLSPVRFAGACASIDHGVVRHAVGWHARLHHLRKPLLSAYKVVGLSASIDDGRVAHHIGLDVVINHVIQPHLRSVGVDTLGAGVDECVVHGGAGLHLLGVHTLQDLLGARHVCRLDDRAQECSKTTLAIDELAFLHAIKPSLRPVDVADADASVEARDIADGIGLDTVGDHCFQPTLSAVGVFASLASSHEPVVGDNVGRVACLL
mmetsp:Transcript_55759/g.120017  ORF Transcript_55759/g.120017 Transcript_55759/m.120017 type:complete len:315 (+) Transcript_55759:293-1237(+)